MDITKSKFFIYSEISSNDLLLRLIKFGNKLKLFFSSSIVSCDNLKKFIFLKFNIFLMYLKGIDLYESKKYFLLPDQAIPIFNFLLSRYILFSNAVLICKL